MSQPYNAQADDAISRICSREAASRRVFRPQTVPAFAATEIFNYLRKKYPDYFYKEASLNPTNLRNRVADWEEDILKVFRNRPDLTLLDGERMTRWASRCSSPGRCARRSPAWSVIPRRPKRPRTW